MNGKCSKRIFSGRRGDMLGHTWMTAFLEWEREKVQNRIASAAPEMYEALKAARERLPDLDALPKKTPTRIREIVEMVDAALAKAEGREVKRIGVAVRCRHCGRTKQPHAEAARVWEKMMGRSRDAKQDVGRRTN